MSPELEDKLIKKYPELFRDKDKPETESLMCFGCEHADGWYKLLDTLCAGIAQHIRNGHYQAPPDQPYRFVQIKEKFGGLRVYDWGHDERIAGLIWMAESMSYQTCELCGERGDLCVASSGYWLRTLCPACAEKHEYRKRTKEDEDA